MLHQSEGQRSHAETCRMGKTTTGLADVKLRFRRRITLRITETHAGVKLQRARAAPRARTLKYRGWGGGATARTTQKSTASSGSHQTSMFVLVFGVKNESPPGRCGVSAGVFLLLLIPDALLLPRPFARHLITV